MSEVHGCIQIDAPIRGTDVEKMSEEAEYDCLSIEDKHEEELSSVNEQTVRLWKLTAALLALSIVGLLIAVIILATGKQHNSADQTSVFIDSPGAYTDALLKVTASGCTQRYVVANNLYGTARSYNTSLGTGPTYLDGRGVDFNKGGVAVAWFSGRVALETFLNSEESGCCGTSVANIQQCFCKIATGVGLLGAGASAGNPPWQYDYLVTKAIFDNQTSQLSQPSVISLIQPTWANLLGILNQTFDDVLGVGQGPSCAVSEEVRVELEASSGLAGWTSLFHKYESSFEHLGCDVSTCETITAADFEGLPSEALCTDTAAVRAYLMRFFDANPYFTGSGSDGDGAEFVVVPNLPSSDVAEVGRFSFALSQSTMRVC